MPAFYDFDDPSPDGPDEVLDGNDERQVEALRDYVLSLDPLRAEPMLAEARPSAPEPLLEQDEADAEEVHDAGQDVPIQPLEATTGS